MPYPGKSPLPDPVRKLSAFKQHVWRSTFNSCHKQGRDESSCFAIAYAAAKRESGKKG